MSARDIYHEHVRESLENDGWSITDDPFKLNFDEEDKNMYIDLGAEKVIIANKENQKIAVEIKSFIGDSVTSDFHIAVGQYMNYKALLKKIAPDRKLFLAISEEAYSQISKSIMLSFLLKVNRLKIIIFNPINKEIIKWIK